MAVIKVTKENFSEVVLEQKGTVLIDFWASWCGPCSMMSPIVDEVEKEESNLVVGKVNVDEQPELTAQFHVNNIPTLIVFKNGQAVNRSMGSISKSAVKKLL